MNTYYKPETDAERKERLSKQRKGSTAGTHPKVVEAQRANRKRKSS